MENALVRIILGSKSDRKVANIILTVLNEIGIPHKVSIASCHWNTGAGLEEFIRGIEEELLVLIGGLQFNIPSIAETINKTGGQTYKIVLAIPTDKIAKHANEDFPAGTAVFMAGFNSIIPEAGYINSALGIAKLTAFRHIRFRDPVRWHYEKLTAKKTLKEEVLLEKGLIPGQDA